MFEKPVALSISPGPRKSPASAPVLSPNAPRTCSKQRLWHLSVSVSKHGPSTCELMCETITHVLRCVLKRAGSTRGRGVLDFGVGPRAMVSSYMCCRESQYGLWGMSVCRLLHVRCVNARCNTGDGAADVVGGFESICQTIAHMWRGIQSHMVGERRLPLGASCGRCLRVQLIS